MVYSYKIVNKKKLNKAIKKNNKKECSRKGFGNVKFNGVCLGIKS